MLACKLPMLIFAAGLFAAALSIVAHDVYAAIRLCCLVEYPHPFRRNGRGEPTRHAMTLMIFGGTAGARSVSRDRRPQPLWVARLASQKERP